MTAEIALLNRTAVALGADSFATIEGLKTYDSEEKIFELQRSQPIALMVYNNLDFLGVPFEILAREFRNKSSKEFFYLVEVWPEFEKYLLEDWENSKFNDSSSHLISLLNVELDNLLNQCMNLLSHFDGRELFDPFDIYLNKAISSAKSNKLPNFLRDEQFHQFNRTYGNIIDQIVAHKFRLFFNFGKFENTDIEKFNDKFQELAFSLVRSTNKSPLFTGLVFSGFGTNNRFPALHSVEIDGVYFDQIRVIKDDRIEIDQNQIKGDIALFAQTDMPERFIFGMDSGFEQKLKGMAQTLTEECLAQLPDTIDATQRERVKQSAIENFMTGLKDSKDSIYNEIKFIVSILSKKDLSEMAYSLVELTSKKRRYSKEMETVGGPIDVAILTRNEGFVWIKRKHYFGSELNPGYKERFKLEYIEHGGRNGKS